MSALPLKATPPILRGVASVAAVVEVVAVLAFPVRGPTKLDAVMVPPFVILLESRFNAPANFRVVNIPTVVRLLEVMAEDNVEADNISTLFILNTFPVCRFRSALKLNPFEV